MRVVIVTGMSGAGKSTALKVLEDVGYFCVDNLPIPLFPKLSELLKVPGPEFNKIALGLDIRGGAGIFGVGGDVKRNFLRDFVFRCKRLGVD